MLSQYISKFIEKNLPQPQQNHPTRSSFSKLIQSTSELQIPNEITSFMEFIDYCRNNHIDEIALLLSLSIYINIILERGFDTISFDLARYYLDEFGNIKSIIKYTNFKEKNYLNDIISPRNIDIHSRITGADLIPEDDDFDPTYISSWFSAKLVTTLHHSIDDEIGLIRFKAMEYMVFLEDFLSNKEINQPDELKSTLSEFTEIASAFCNKMQSLK